MPLKPKTVLSRDDFRAALDSHQISISQVAKATGVPRAYLSEFLSIGRQLRPDQLQKIRDHLESEGVEFDDDAPAGDSGEALPPGLAVANICHFPILPDRVGEAKAVLAEIESNDKLIAALLDKPAVRESAFFSSRKGEFTEETADDIRSLYGRCAANYMFFRYLTLEKNPLVQGGGKYTLRSVFIEMAKKNLENAGIDHASLGPQSDDEPAPAEVVS